jgi:hypothetical protein
VDEVRREEGKGKERERSHMVFFATLQLTICVRMFSCFFT